MTDRRRWTFGSADGGRSRLVGAVAAALLFGFVVLFSATLWNAFTQAAEKRVEAAEDIARLIEIGVTRTLESAETTLTVISENAAGDPADLRRQMLESLRFAPHIRQITVIRADGSVAADTRDGTQAGARLDIGRLRLPDVGVGGLSNGLRIGRATPGRYLPLQGEPEGPVVRTVLPVAMHAGGGLQVVAALNPGHFRDLLHDAPMGSNGGLALVQFDGTPVIAVGAAAATATTGGLDLTAAVGSETERGLLSLPADGAFERVAAFRLSARYPVAVAAIIDHRDSFAAWVGANRQMLFWTASAVVALMLLGLVLYREVVRRLRLQDEVRLLFEAVEQSVTAIIITDPAGRIVYVNPAFSRLTGYPVEEAVGRNPRFLKSGHTPAAEYGRLWSRLKAGEPWHGEFRNRTRDGGEVWEMATISPVRDGDGRVTHYIAAKLDITAAKQAEVERERLIGALDRANRELTRFAEIAAHHLQEPVRRLLVFADIAGRPGQEPEKIAHAAERIRQNATSLRDQLRDIQTYLAAGEPHGPTLRRDPVDIARRVAAQSLAGHGDVQARVEVGPLPPVALDGARLSLALGHLIDNGLKYHRPGLAPVVTVTAEAGTAAGRVLYRIEDNGRGIPSRYWGRAGDVFERLEADETVPGTGIGLAIVRRIVESVGGSLRVEASGTLGGAAVLLDLPLEDAAVAAAVMPTEAPAAVAQVPAAPDVVA